jgi:predicted chitinase
MGGGLPQLGPTNLFDNPATNMNMNQQIGLPPVPTVDNLPAPQWKHRPASLPGSETPSGMLGGGMQLPGQGAPDMTGMPFQNKGIDLTGGNTKVPSTGTLKQFDKFFPNARPEIANTIKNNTDILKQAGINTPRRLEHFLAQMGHETGGFRLTHEQGSRNYFRRYDGRRDLGNVKPGDGYRYRGRGIIQLTGRSNYRTYGKKLGVDLEGNPDLAADPKVALRVAAQYWNDRGLNALADRNDIRGITRRINGGYNGFNDRVRRYRQ